MSRAIHAALIPARLARPPLGLPEIRTFLAAGPAGVMRLSALVLNACDDRFINTFRYHL